MNTGFLSLVSGVITSTITGLSPTAIGTLQTAAQSVHRQIHGKLQPGISELRAIHWIDEDDSQTARFQHYYKGVQVLGSMAIHHTEKATPVEHIRDRLAEFDLSTQARLSVSDATHLLQFRHPGQTLLAAPILKIMPDRETASARLVYSADLDAGAGKPAVGVLLDAESGNTIAENPTQMSADFELSIAPIQVYTAAKNSVSITRTSESIGAYSTCSVEDVADGKKRDLGLLECGEVFLGKNEEFNNLCQWVDGEDGYPIRTNLENCESQFNSRKMTAGDDAAAQRAVSNSGKILSYFRTNFKRESYDGKGAPVVSIVHGGHQMQNAFWSNRTKTMTYGDGDGKEMLDFTLALDIAGHEFTHAIVAATADLDGYGEAGSLNEAYADFFGEMIELQATGKADWVFGAAVVPTVKGKENKGLRSMKHPGKDPSKLSEEHLAAKGEVCNGHNDYCFVHENATIPGHASYLVAQAIGAEKAQKLYFRTLTRTLTSSETFRSAAQATVEMCGTLYEKATCDAVEKAYRTVGLM